MFVLFALKQIYFYLLKPLQRNNRSIKSAFTIHYNIVTKAVAILLYFQGIQRKKGALADALSHSILKLSIHMD